jgi:glycosyltransferase involved in cell wall biosynthesis
MIGLHMLVWNEEVLLPRLLNYIKPHVAEMVIIVDDRTVDRTGHIARSYGATALPYTLNHDFAAARNYGLAQMIQPWVLQVDADEWPEEGLLKWFHQFLVSERASRVDCISVWRENWIDGQPIGEQTYEWQHRLFRRQMRFVGRIHETIVPQEARRAYAPKEYKLLHHKTSKRQEMRNRQYMEWPEQREIVNASS